ncbi:hypothetical protein BT96DRAFT_950089 [Gymnopus androsaceus JB14]|uniref:Uncharacterized protein n=1 Tax=Gymnopus androsaceus JB14 TaxID=1447944 RepID=A0A6A4GHT0_9AGAR|nr:hypothetical protein BT96DRAFT_950089 [Gymnopus androsaceus JB14]
MSERYPSPDPFTNNPEPQLSPMSSLRALMSRRNGIRDCAAFEQDSTDPFAEGSGGGHDAGSIAIDPMLAAASPLNAMLDRVRAIKRLCVISPDSVRDFEAFENAQSPPEHLAHVFLVGLENRDAFRLLTSSVDYRVPETLKTTCKDYAWVYILSPTIMQYKGKTGPANVLAAMRQLNVNNLPPPSETGRCDVIMEIIKKGMTDARHNIKEKITSSVKNEAAAHRDIAALTRACIATSKAKPTAALFVRIAFLRWQFNQYPTCVTDKFWDKVDETLVKYRTEFNTAAELQPAFEAIFHSNKEKYGQPDLVLNPSVAIRDVNEWLLKVSSAAGPFGVAAVAPPTISAAPAVPSSSAASV